MQNTWAYIGSTFILKRENFASGGHMFGNVFITMHYNNHTDFERQNTTGTGTPQDKEL